ncbi:MAG: sigma-70 family RNA polymerase sigma factor [Planctomycetes bacterium]|nr:sigma-70 family RNA polymerase sigma factor [Planctomycetota bacterium]
MERSLEDDALAIRDVDDAASWDRAIEAAQPARMLALIDANLDHSLRAHATAEDIWQETLLLAWRRRAGFRWQGLAPFRRWLLEIALHCTADARSHWRTLKRGDGRVQPIEFEREGLQHSAEPPIFGSTTPSRVAQLREQASVMRMALEALDDDVREIVKLRVFGELSCDEVAARLGLGVSAVKHRARRGTLEYERRLRTLLGSGDGGRGPRA